MSTAVFAIHTYVGREKTMVKRLAELAQKCKEVISATATPWPGYVGVKVIVGNCNRVELPKDTKAIIELVPGVIKVLDDETLPL